jgi:hypothetical protein
MLSTSLSSLDCFTDDDNDGVFDAQKSIQFNRYAQDDNDRVITTLLCETEFQTGCNGEAYVVRHPEYDRETEGNDTALVFLPEDKWITVIPNVALNCNPNVPVRGQELEAFGWGFTCEPLGTAAPIPAPDEPTAAPTPTAFTECLEGRDPIEIQTGMLEYLTNQECASLKGKTIPDNNLCAKTNSSKGVAVGSGDSGMCDSWA